MTGISMICGESPPSLSYRRTQRRLLPYLYTTFLQTHFCHNDEKINAPATDKQKLIGHAKFEMTAYYTHTDIESLKNITDHLE